MYIVLLCPFLAVQNTSTCLTDVDLGDISKPRFSFQHPYSHTQGLSVCWSMRGCIKSLADCHQEKILHFGELYSVKPAWTLQVQTPWSSVESPVRDHPPSKATFVENFLFMFPCQWTPLPGIIIPILKPLLWKVFSSCFHVNEPPHQVLSSLS